MYPLFFSVASHDLAFAEEIYLKFPADWIYLYSKTGEEGVKLWNEIAIHEIPNCQFFVVFWSKNFIEAPGCRRELELASNLINEGKIAGLVIRLDDYPLEWKSSFGEEAKVVFEALKPLLSTRTSREKVQIADATHLIGRVVEPILVSDHPQLPRDDVAAGLRQAVQKERFTCFPAAWISGYNGVGRLTAIKELNRAFAPNGRAIIVDINETALPKQILAIIYLFGPSTSPS